MSNAAIKTLKQKYSRKTYAPNDLNGFEKKEKKHKNCSRRCDEAPHDFV